MNDPRPGDFTIVLRPARDRLGRSPAVRLRRLLKFAGRQCGLRCIEVRPALPAREAGCENYASPHPARSGGGNRRAAGESRANS